MSRSARWSLVALLAVGGAVAVAAVWSKASRAQQDRKPAAAAEPSGQESGEKPGPAPGQPSGAKPQAARAATKGGARAVKAGRAPVVAEPFDHDLHRKAGVDINQNCDACHHANDDGTLLLIADNGHKPCLDARCHAMDFVAVGARMRQADPGRYADAAAFCAGCHPQGTPSPWQAAPAAIDYRDGLQQFHVEMGHFQHVETRAKCRDCHVVDENTYALKLDTPGHAECGTCHAASASPPMSACASCHDEPGPEAYFSTERKRSDVRSCGSPAHLALSEKRGTRAPCFEHERVEHRQKGGARLECGACHYMFEDKKFWGKGRSYDTLKDVKAAPLIDNAKDIAHDKVCGGSDCHAKDVRPPPRGNCTLCHDAKISQGLFD